MIYTVGYGHLFDVFMFDLARRFSECSGLWFVYPVLIHMWMWSGSTLLSKVENCFMDHLGCTLDLFCLQSVM